MRIALFVLALLVAACSGGETGDPSTSKADVAQMPPPPGQAWTCSMHPEVRENAAGRCPKCNMDLLSEKHTNAGASSEPFYCPMHPEVRSATKGRCPKCNMFLVEPGQEADHGHSHGGGDP